MVLTNAAPVVMWRVRKARERPGKAVSQSLPAGDTAGGTLETVINGFKLGVILAPVWKRFSCKG